MTDALAFRVEICLVRLSLGKHPTVSRRYIKTCSNTISIIDDYICSSVTAGTQILFT